MFFSLSLLFKPLWLFNNQNLGIPGDDMSYWLHSATIALDFDLDYTNDYKLDSNIIPEQMFHLTHQVQDIYLLLLCFYSVN